jgi:hypothetical protein
MTEKQSVSTQVVPLNEPEKIKIRHVVNEAAYNLPTVPGAIFRKIQGQLKYVNRERILDDIDNVPAGELKIFIPKEKIEAALDGPYRADNLKRACQAITTEPMYAKIGYTKDGQIRETEIFSSLVGAILINRDGITAEFTPTQLQIHCHGYFTEYEERLTANFKLFETYRIFDLVMKEKNMGRLNDQGYRVWTVSIPLVDLHWMLRSKKSYVDKFHNFKVNILDKCCEEINEGQNEVVIKWDEGKRVKRKIQNIVFRAKMEEVIPSAVIEIPDNDRWIEWLRKYFEPTEPQIKMVWQDYVTKGRGADLEKIYQKCKVREARTDKEPLDSFKSYFWGMVKKFKDKPLK